MLLDKALRDLVNKIKGCGYFSQTPGEAGADDEGEEEEKAVGEEAEEEVEEPGEEDTEEVLPEEVRSDNALDHAMSEWKYCCLNSQLDWTIIKMNKLSPSPSPSLCLGLHLSHSLCSLADSLDHSHLPTDLLYLSYWLFSLTHTSWLTQLLVDLPFFHSLTHVSHSLNHSNSPRLDYSW